MHISEINLYPIKSLKGISVDSARVEPRGLQYDRRWMLTDKDGKFLTQREFPRMATITTEVMSDELRVMSDGIGELRVPLEPRSGARQQVTIWQSVCHGVVYDDEVNQWFSDVLSTPCQLVYMPDDTRRSVNDRFDRGGEIVSFADGYPLLVIGEASLADLNKRIGTRTPPSAGGDAEPPPRPSATPTNSGGEFFEPLPMNRFRPNIVVTGSEPYAEDNWTRIRVGNAVFRTTKPCERCVVPTVDQQKGEFAGKEPLRTLATYRVAKDVMPERFEALGVTPNAVLFGQNLIAETPGATVRLGDEVEIMST